VEQGRSPITLLEDKAEVESRGPIPLDGIGPTGRWEKFWAEAIADLRAGSPWASTWTAALGTGPAGVRAEDAEPEDPTVFAPRSGAVPTR
jgi:hypothetical protein